MPLAFRQWHLYRFDFMVTRWRFELQTHCLKGKFQNFLACILLLFSEFLCFLNKIELQNVMKYRRIQCEKLANCKQA